MYSLPFGLTPQILFMLFVMAFMIGTFIYGKLRADVVAILIMVIVALSHVLPFKLIFIGFANNAVISLIGIIIMGAGLEKTGIMGSVSKLVLKFSHGKERRLLLGLALSTGVFSGFMRSLGAFALALPIINRLTLFLHIPRSRLLMPIGFTAIVGGTLTLIGSGPLILLNGLIGGNALQNGPSDITQLKPIDMFTVFPVGLSLLVATILFFWFFGRRVLPEGHDKAHTIGTDLAHFQRIYGFGGKFIELKIAHQSPLAGITLSEFEKLLVTKNIAVLAVSNGRGILVPPLRKTRLLPDSRIAVVGDKEIVKEFAKEYGLQISKQLKVFADVFNPMRSGFSEVVIPPGSELINQNMNELHMRRRHNVQVLSLFRGNRFYHGNEMKLLTIRSGDTLGVFSQWTNLAGLAQKREFAVVTTDYPKQAYNPKKRWHAIFFLLFSMLLIIAFHVQAGVGLMFGAIGMILTRVIDIDQAYEAISWKTIFLLAGLIPFGLAMQTTGTATWIADGLFMVFGHLPQWVLLLALAVLAALFSLLMSNVGATVVLAPIAIHLAIHIHANPRLFAIVTALATSNAFLIPTHQVNALIAGPGGYDTKDFLKVGSLLSLLYLAVLIPSSYLFLT